MAFLRINMNVNYVFTHAYNFTYIFTEYPGKCYIERTKKAYSVDEKWQYPDECTGYRCAKEGDKFVVIGST